LLKSFLAKNATVVALGLASVGLLSAGTVSPSTTFTGSITLTSNQFDNYFVYNANSGAVSGIKGVGVTNPFTQQTDFVPAGTFPVTASIPQYISSGVATALGLYSSTGVSVAVNQNVYNAALGKEVWDQVFPGTSEASIAAALAGGDQTALLAFLNSYSNDFVSFNSNTSTPISAGILHFSNAAAGGSLTFANITAVGAPPSTGGGSGPVSATPEPSAQLLLGAGLSVVALAVRKFRKA
jgi:hypothetical protein